MKATLPCLSGCSLGVAILLLSLAATSARAQGVAQCAQIPCDDVRTVATAAASVPVEHDFTATAGTTYYVTLTDLGTQFNVPQPLATLKMAITANDALVNVTPIFGSSPVAAGVQLVVEGANAVSTNGVGVASFTATTAGVYRFHIVGAPASGHGPGPIGLTVSATQSGAPLQSWSDSIGPAGAPPATAEGVLQQTFTVTTAGAYQISVTDLHLPQALQTPPQMLVLLNGSVIALLPDTGGNLTTTATLQTGTYQMFALGLAASQASGGLFSASVLPAVSGGGAPAFSWTVPVGTTIALGGAVQLTPGAQYSLTLNDLAFPLALSQATAASVDISRGNVAATLTTSGAQSFMASGSSAADTYQLYASAQAAATPGAGSYAVQILNSSAVAVSGAAQAVTTSSSSLVPFSFTADVPAAGAYTATLTDLQIPVALSSAQFALVQGGLLVGTPSSSAGTITANLAAGSASLTLLGFAQSSSSAGSLMDLSLADSTGKLVFDQPQGVGAAFRPTQISITNSGSYQFTLADLAWPASFSQSGAQLIGVLTHGGTVVGQIFGGGTLNAISVTTAGNYYLSIIATPTGTDQAGTYALNVSPTPAAPTVALTSDAASVTSGGTVHLLWTTTNANSCTASGGGWSGAFTGTQAVMGQATSPAITANTTFTLTCTGAGGTGMGGITISLVTTSGGGGGGGAVGLDALVVLLAALLTRRFAVGAGTVRRFMLIMSCGVLGVLSLGTQSASAGAPSSAPGIAASTSASAAPSPAPAPPAVLEKVRAALKQSFPQLEILQLSKSPVPGLYELTTVEGIVYVDATGEHLLNGQMMETKTRRDLTMDRWATLNAIDFDSLPFNLAIKSVRGKGTRRLAVFADPKCPFCQELEREEISKLDDITVYTFLYPLEDVHPGATALAHQIWCTQDRESVWTQWMQKQIAVPAAQCMDDPLKTLAALGNKLHIISTPTIFFASGRRSAGLPPAKQFEHLLETESQAPPARTASAPHPAF